MVLSQREESLINMVRALPPQEAGKVLDWARQLADLAGGRAIEWSDVDRRGYRRSDSGLRATLRRPRGGRLVKPGDCQHGKKSGDDTRGSAPASPGPSHSKQALHACLRRLKAAKDDRQFRRLTGELQRILFHKQYRDAGN